MKNTKPSFPLNAWYAAAYDVEVGRQLLARTVCKQKLVMFRRTDGQVAVLEDAAEVTSLRIAREAIIFPERAYGPVQWRIGIASQRESATVFADASGTITSADLSGTIRAQNLDMLAQDDWPAAEAQAELAGAVGDATFVVELQVAKSAVQVATEVPEINSDIAFFRPFI